MQMRPGFMRKILAILLLVGMAPFATATQAQNPLPIQPIAQQTPAWCWLAALEMIFRYYHVPAINPISYQCGMAAAVFAGPCLMNCAICTVGSGPVDTIKAVIDRYPVFARNYTHISGPDLTADVGYNALSADEVKDEIDAGRPIIAGISPHSGLLPPGLSEHAVVIVGYQGQGGARALLVNDPFPYGAVGIQDPYTGVGGVKLMLGRYRISYDAMVNELGWGNTVSGIDKQ